MRARSSIQRARGERSVGEAVTDFKRRRELANDLIARIWFGDRSSQPVPVNGTTLEPEGSDPKEAA